MFGSTTTTLALALFVTTFPAVRGQYTWPDPKYEELESLRWDQIGLGSTFLELGLTGSCTAFVGGSNTGRANAADWIRTAYHDMATHNSEDGTGGLDASIRFPEEQARAENAGDGFLDTFNFLSAASDRFVSYADIIAIGAIIAIESCGGPEIDFRFGRIDATEPNIPGVPEPRQTLDEHIASFRKQGFNQSEMISLIACGHSFGGVQHTAFPDLVPELNDTTNTQSAVHFDTTFTNFDNNVAKEYIAGTTLNPLVVGSNDTTNSDKRIFGSDGNVTMNAFAADENLYANICAALFARMLDTVPSGVVLTDVVTPIPVKPTQVELIHHGDGTLLFNGGSLRLWNVPVNTARAVNASWTDRAGVESPSVVLRHTSGMYPSASIVVNETSAVASFRFVVSDDSSVAAQTFTMPYLVLLSDTSCRLSNTIPSAWNLNVAVRKGTIPSRIYATRLNVLPAPTVEYAEYDIWTVLILSDDDTFNSYGISYELDGKTFEVLTSIVSVASVGLCA
ncbi:heme peroxidase [Mycena rosella]|uniref:Peroxidase n=1 Tax=Mycena rosella TaxID=1033263 RepID=A0AAD7CU77_MYCRO|nr:heme peroxidase [Mycena rosella]